MRCSVFGVQEIDFIGKDDKPIKGKCIYCGFENRYVKGLKTNKFFIPLTVDCYNDIIPDIDIELSFDYNGKIDNVVVY